MVRTHHPSLNYATALATVALLASPAIAQDAGTGIPAGDPVITGDAAVAPLAAPAPTPAGQVQIEGTVTSVDALNGVFVMDTGSRDIRIEVAGMEDYPLDADGTPQVTVGDRVRVTARAGTGDTGGMLQMMATSLVVLPD